MKNRKGFTIVELVIVIAVIAILAAVLIPTFSGVIQKTNNSAALQEATSTMKSTLAMSDYGTISDGTIFVVKDYDTTKGYRFMYKNNSIDSTDSVVAFNETTTGYKYNSIIINSECLKSNNTLFDEKIDKIIKAALNNSDTNRTVGNPVAAATNLAYDATVTVTITGSDSTEVWYIFTNTDYAKDVVTFTYSDIKTSES